MNKMDVNGQNDLKLLNIYILQPIENYGATTIDEVFTGSCMTHLDHVRSAARLVDGELYAKTRLWVTPTTRLDQEHIPRERCTELVPAGNT